MLLLPAPPELGNQIIPMRACMNALKRTANGEGHRSSQAPGLPSAPQTLPCTGSNVVAHETLWLYMLLGYQVKEQHTSRKAAAENRNFTPNLKEKKNPPSDYVTIHNVKIFWKCTKLTSHSPLEIRFVSDELGLCCN